MKAEGRAVTRHTPPLHLASHFISALSIPHTQREEQAHTHTHDTRPIYEENMQRKPTDTHGKTLKTQRKKTLI